jgi:putative oxidoreductase
VIWAQVIEALVRVGLVVLFLPFSALDKIFNFRGAVGQASDIFAARPLAILAILVGLVIEIFMSLGIITGTADRACALIMAGYCVATAILWKQFWAQGDFWSDSGGKGRSLFWDFLKNLSLGAGFLLIVVGLDGSGLQEFIHHPLASSHSYSLHEGQP